MLKHKTNPDLVATITALRRAGRTNEAQVWRFLAKALEKPARNWAAVNVGHLERVANGVTSMVVVPGKVLGAGELSKGLTVAAWGFSESAREKITAAGGRCLSYEDAVAQNPQGTGVMVVRQ